MFYWILTYFLYRLTHVFSQAMFSDSIWDTAESNALKILYLEQFTPLRFFFPIQEISVQKYFLSSHPTLLTILNKAYALIHIPGTVYFLAWYYSAASNHKMFAIVRRTMTLCNLLAFTIFSFYPCMPPRLLPKEYGFVDTVRRDSAESVFMKGGFVNHLAAMPSMHFGYALIVGMTCFWHAGGFGCWSRGYRNHAAWGWKAALATFGILYPLTVLLIIIATANHYWLDAVAAAATALVALAANRVFVVLVPLEDWLLWLLRVHRPRHTRGEKEERGRS
ncbi:PAP2 superfamily-domain-containing protein [Pyronema omphalodes]|nr:PAP2 superfamily-domain-containing protein [Pyronema omphalodes]